MSDEEYSDSESEQDDGEEFSSDDEPLSDLQEESDGEGLENIDACLDEFEEGLTITNRIKVKQARKLYFEDKQKQFNSIIAKEVSSKVKEKWADILDTVGEHSLFDFNILKSLVNSDGQSNKETPTRTQELDIKQQGDEWDYTIGLKEEIENSLNSIDEKEEASDTEEEELDDEITDSDDD